MMRVIDTHAHLDELDDPEPAVQAARDAGLEAVVSVGLDMPSSARTLELAARHPGFVYPAIGWYPANVREEEIEDNLHYLETNLVNAVAIGEIGLDYVKRVKDAVSIRLQQEVLAELLKLARNHRLPAVLHTRYAWKDALKIAVDVGLEEAVFHFYTGPSSVLKDIVEAGYYVSVGPAAEYNEDMRRVVRDTPPDRLLLETDCPFVFKKFRRADEPPATPVEVLRALKAAAEILKVPEVELAEITTANARRLFGIG